ncbi:D-alanyl-D-alanine carboxypeptidase family protein [Dactylosporangium sp. AC04546]|uniref:D-alanyl-D-alanine carboxypeptidase family protein n=1 Tax=Dactylosporangium sp. AC04546 TaxID=2862460 RepID=UPI001EE03C72|nr:D-alanyl-D-alanine carboxypeptidase family protein [Dactylosporangium sp. AC04546]WVK88537.1 D-alanyl-D-alanine carboxypeptidase family protein [Dactylosporangium sp. AC04546]
MAGSGFLAVVTGVVLLASPTPAVSAPVDAVVPCPYASIATIPPTPASPPRDTSKAPVGGELLGTTGLAVPGGAPAPPTLSAMSWVVADLDTGEVLGACAPHLRRRPASVQKLLLAATALPKLDPNLVVEATAEDLALPADSSAVGMIVGGKYPVSTLWYGLLLQSGNDTANALARMAGGDGGVPATIAAMNAEARRLGADDTHAVTPSGLDAPDQLTSAYDLALIARVDLDRPDFLQYDTRPTFQWPAQPPKDPKGFQIQNENKLLTNYPGALGGKTGFTDEARHTYVGAAQRDGRRLVVTLMGAEIVPGRTWKQASMLLDWGFAVPKGSPVGHLVTPAEAEELHRTPPSASAQAQAEQAKRVRSSSQHYGLLGLLGGLALLIIVGAVVAVRRLR